MSIISLSSVSKILTWASVLTRYVIHLFVMHRFLEAEKTLIFFLLHALVLEIGFLLNRILGVFSDKNELTHWLHVIAFLSILSEPDANYNFGKFSLKIVRPPS